jgi:hypothetical protein
VNNRLSYGIFEVFFSEHLDIRFQETGNTLRTRSISANGIGGYGERKITLERYAKDFSCR